MGPPRARDPAPRPTSSSWPRTTAPSSPSARSVLEQACRRAKAWLDTIGVRLEVGVNLSARQFQQADLEEQIAERARSPPGSSRSQLCLEITESLAMYDVELTSAVLDQAPRPRHPAGHRRLRHRALLTRVPGPVPHRRHQDRPELRARHRPGPGQVRHRLRRRRPVPGHRLDDRRGGGRDAGASSSRSRASAATSRRAFTSPGRCRRAPSTSSSVRAGTPACVAMPGGTLLTG